MSWGIVAAVGGSIVGGAIAADGASDAADTQAAAADRATQAQREMFDKQVELQQPWHQAGQTGLNRLLFELGLTPTSTDPAYGNVLREFSAADFQQDPGYAFRQEQGEKGLQRAAAAGGGLGSGRYLKDAMRFNQGLASQEYGAAFDRFTAGKANRFNRLASLAGIGQTAANQTGAAAGRFGEQIGGNILAGGAAQAAGRVGSASAWNDAIGQGVSMYQQNELMKRFQPPTGGYRYTVPTYDGAEY
jgi:hypothetical protein